MFFFIPAGKNQSQIFFESLPKEWGSLLTCLQLVLSTSTEGTLIYYISMHASAFVGDACFLGTPYLLIAVSAHLRRQLRRWLCGDGRTKPSESSILFTSRNSVSHNTV